MHLQKFAGRLRRNVRVQLMQSSDSNSAAFVADSRACCECAPLTRWDQRTNEM